MARFVDCETERDNLLAFGFNQRHMRVMDRVFLLHALATIASVLRTAVADQKHNLGLGVLVLQLGYSVPDCCSHARCMQRCNLIDPPLDLVAELFVDVFDDIELDVLPSVAGEPINPIGVADGLQRIDQEGRAFFL